MDVDYRSVMDGILEELAANARRVRPGEAEALAEAVLAARRVFVAGAGRAGYAARGFAMRLAHLGLAAHFVGEPTTPAIGPGDLLVINSGSGETGSLVVMARRAREAGAKLATVTIHPEATVGRLADVTVTLPGATPKSGLTDTAPSRQPMGSAFEQLSWLTFDAVVAMLMERMGKGAEDMFALHANLE